MYYFEWMDEASHTVGPVSAVEWNDDVEDGEPCGGGGWRCFDCAAVYWERKRAEADADRERMLAEQARILQAAQQRG